MWVFFRCSFIRFYVNRKQNKKGNVCSNLNGF
uniref:Uncharacterized protein n=1 Tax=Rhizophora mucronata TaxID=61149 RepID=A0A2P2PXT4_RHIMU